MSDQAWLKLARKKLKQIKTIEDYLAVEEMFGLPDRRRD